jgi:uncharacterized protein YecT (DUF1311 family)
MTGLLFLALCPFSAAGQNSRQYRACGETAYSQFQMNKCASEEAARTDSALNDAYQILLKLVARNVNAGQKIRTAQRAWLAYRDAYINAMYPADDKQANYGSMYPMEVDLLRAELTTEQAKAILALSERYRGNSL